jgi:hypothetical protein
MTLFIVVLLIVVIVAFFIRMLEARDVTKPQPTGNQLPSDPIVDVEVDDTLPVEQQDATRENARTTSVEAPAIKTSPKARPVKARQKKSQPEDDTQPKSRTARKPRKDTKE